MYYDSCYRSYGALSHVTLLSWYYACVLVMAEVVVVVVVAMVLIERLLCPSFRPSSPLILPCPLNNAGSRSDPISNSYIQLAPSQVSAALL